MGGELPTLGPGALGTGEEHPPKFRPGRVTIRTNEFRTHLITAIQPQLNKCQGENAAVGELFLGEGAKRLPEWAQRVRALRKGQLRLSQTQFAALLGLTVTTISSWETGLKEPSAEHYIKMANLATAVQRLWFWEHVGIDLATVPGAAAALRSAQQGKRKIS